MSETLTDPPPIACTLGASDFRDRLAWIAELNATALRGAQRRDLQLELTYAPEALARVRDLVAREQACCAFLIFDVEATATEVRLIITAPEAAREAAETVFAPFAPASAASAGCGCCAGVSA